MVIFITLPSKIDVLRLNKMEEVLEDMHARQ